MGGDRRSGVVQLSAGPLASMSDEELVTLVRGLSNGILSELMRRGHEIHLSVDPDRIDHAYPDGPLKVRLSEAYVRKQQVLHHH